jgi:hypothetical protein
MTADRDTTRIVRSWLRTDEHESADRVLEDVLASLDTTPQRRHFWPSRRFAQMNNVMRVAIGAAAVVVVAFLGYNLLPGPGGFGGTPTPGPTVTPTPAPTAAPSPSQGPWVLTDGPLPPHEYFTRPFAPPNENLTFTFTVPDGWVGFGSIGATKATAGPSNMGFGFGLVERLYSDPCQALATGDVLVGPTVDDLATALQLQTGYEATSPADVTLGGFSGLRMDLQLPVDLPCDMESFFVWEGGIYAQGPGDRWHLWILDVEGVRVVILARDFAATPAEDQAELLAIVESIQIDPRP